MSSVVVAANTVYSASTLDLSTVSCFLEDQDTKFAPRYALYLVVELLVVAHPAQYASENP